MSIVFPAGKNKFDWAPDPEKIEKKLQKVAGVGAECIMADDEVESDSQFDAIKDMPFIADQISDEIPDQEDAPQNVMDVKEVKDTTDTNDIAEQVEQVVEEAAAKATEAIEQVVEKVKEVVEKVEEKTEKKDETDEKKDDVVVVDLPKDEGKKDDEVVVDISVDSNGTAKIDDIPGGTVGIDGKESGEKCADAGKKEDQEKKISSAKVKVEAKKVSADTNGKFLKIADCSPEVIKDVREYWLALGFPAEYVDAMTKNY